MWLTLDARRHYLLTVSLLRYFFLAVRKHIVCVCVFVYFKVPLLEWEKRYMSAESEEVRSGVVVYLRSTRVTKEFSSKPRGVKRAWPALCLQMSPLNVCFIVQPFILWTELKFTRQQISHATICRSNMTGGWHQSSDVCDVQSYSSLLGVCSYWACL